MQSAMAVERKPGVKVGDRVLYDFTLNWVSNDDIDRLFAGDENLKDVYFIEINVLSIADANITYQWINHFKNGSLSQTVYWLDVSNLIYGTPWFIAANLTPGDWVDPIHTTINDTQTRRYLDVERQVNHFGLIKNHTTDIVGHDYHVVGEHHAYWDKTTGILLEIEQNMSYTRIPEGNKTHIFAHILLIDYPVIPEFSLITMIPLMMITLTIAVIIRKKRR